MNKLNALVTAATLVGSSSVAAAENQDFHHPFLPYLAGRADYTIPQAVEVACERGRLEKLLEGLHITPDCSDAGKKSIAAELRKRQVVKSCNELTNDDRIRVSGYSSDGIQRRETDVSCQGETFWGFTDVQRNEIKKWYKPSCLNEVYPDAGYPPEDPIITRLKENLKGTPPPKEVPYCSNNRQNFNYDSRGVVISPNGVHVYSEDFGLPIGSESCDLSLPKK